MRAGGWWLVAGWLAGWPMADGPRALAWPLADGAPFAGSLDSGPCVAGTRLP